MPGRIEDLAGANTNRSVLSRILEGDSAAKLRIYLRTRSVCTLGIGSRGYFSTDVEQPNENVELPH